MVMGMLEEVRAKVVHPYYVVTDRYTVPRGPHRLWRMVTTAPWTSVGLPRPPRPEGLGPGHDAIVEIQPMAAIPADRRRLDPGRAGPLVASLLPGREVNQRWVAFVSPEDPTGMLRREDFIIDLFADYFSAEVGDLSAVVTPRGHVFVSARPVREPSGVTSFDLVDVLMPLWASMFAVFSGAYDRFLGRRAVPWNRCWWTFELSERIAFPTPLAGDRAVGFPGAVPERMPPVRRSHEPGGRGYRGVNYARLRPRPKTVMGMVLRQLLPHWGYTADSAVIAEVVAHLDALRTGRPVATARR